LVVREVVDGDTERGVLLMGPDGDALYANSAVRSLFADGSPRTAQGLLPEAIDTVARALLERASAENEPQAHELPWPSAEERRARVLIEARRRGFSWFVVVRTLRAQVGTEPTIRRLQACWQLTVREAQVAAAVARGQSNGEVATTLGIVEKTVKNVLLAVYQKVGVRNRVELALRAHDVGSSRT
jgi:DNA-binding NarL/FixJ family response regulator